MIKVLCLLIAVCLFHMHTDAQTWDEWFNQKKTQKQYLVKQIVALKMYTGYLSKGLQVARKGLNAISSIKSGEVNVQSDFLKSLGKANPAIKSSGRVETIRLLVLNIFGINKKAYRHAKDSKQFTNEELAYFKKVFSNISNQCESNLQQVLVLTTKGSVEMKDDERLQQLEKIRTDMEDKYLFVQHFSNDIDKLALQRINEENNIHSSQSLNGINR